MHTLSRLKPKSAIFRTLWVLFTTGLFLAACRFAAESPEITATATSISTSAAFGIPTVQPTVTFTSTPPPTLTATPTIPATQTPLPIAHLAVPPGWQERAVRALDLYGQEAGTRVIEMAAVDEADIRLVNEGGEFAVMQEPLVLVVPFTSSWQDISTEDAMEVLTAGHDQIESMPWSEMPRGMKALRVDGRFPTDPAYPFQDIWSLQPTSGFEDAAAEFLPAMQAVSENSLVHIAAVGDIMLDRSLGNAIRSGNLEYPFVGVAEHLRSADITIGNIESALGDTGEAVGKRYPFQAPPEAAESLALAGFDIVSLANNHAGDFGPDSLLQAISLLEEQGISPIGAGANALEAHAASVHEVNGLKLAFLSYVNVPVEASTGFDTASWQASAERPGIAWADPQQIREDIVPIRGQVDLVIVALHSGYEYLAAPSEEQMAAAHAAIDAGADLVIGHHAHILQGIEFYEGGVIIYGTGNFAFEIDGAPETAIFDIWLAEDGVRQIEINPAIIRFGGQPRLAESWEEPAILNEVYYLSSILNAK